MALSSRCNQQAWTQVQKVFNKGEKIQCTSLSMECQNEKVTCILYTSSGGRDHDAVV